MELLVSSTSVSTFLLVDGGDIIELLLLLDGGDIIELLLLDGGDMRLVLVDNDDIDDGVMEPKRSSIPLLIKWRSSKKKCLPMVFNLLLVAPK